MAVKSAILANAWGDDNVAKTVDGLLDILDCDPPMAGGHVVENRQGAALAFRSIIQAIRRGE